MSAIAAYEYVSAFALATCGAVNFRYWHRDPMLTFACSAACFYCALHAISEGLAS